MYRLQKFDAHTTGMHWHRHKGGAAHYRAARELGQRLPVAIALGGPPAAIYAACAPFPEHLDEAMLTGFLMGRPLKVVKALTSDLLVPAEAEVVLEGYVDPAEPWREEGPFGDHTGYYSLADDYPVFHLTTVTHRKNFIYPTTIVGRPPMEDYWLGMATERLFLPLLQSVLPEVVDYHMPAEGVFHNLVFVAIKKQYPGHAFKVMNALWGQGQMMFAKVIVVVDEHVNVQDEKEAWWEALNHIDPQRDVLFTRGPADALDHAAGLPWLHSKMGIDGTRKWPDEGFTRPWPERIVMTPEIQRAADEKLKRWGLWPGK
jgi:4-hydroxy-3-polyprenylbenzoate decarboxylase